ncbi:DUF5642 family protein [Mycobacterium botniense]|uniref:DUF5642 family protein n=1 Tax=Mycobacterium botniense TaxID=84962 RepID=UPI001478C4A8|nr:DUF5642 family protein [Mycobacterium botniense]
MQVHKTVVGVMCAGWLAACSTSHSAHPPDIAKLFTVKSTFGPEYRVTTKGPSGIDPNMAGPQKLPPGVKFDPPGCADYAASRRLPLGLQGKMAVLAADGNGNRFYSIAVLANEAVPFNGIPDNCKHVTFDAGKISGVIDAVDAPRINGAQTVGTHRQIQANAAGKSVSREVYNYAAYLGDLVVMVSVNPVAARDQPPPVIDVERARRLLTDSVSAIRG